MSNALQICSYPKDYSLKGSYDVYEDVTNMFKSRHGRPPACDLFVGAIGDKVDQFSTLTARWENDKKNAGADAFELLHIFNSINS